MEYICTKPFKGLAKSDLAYKMGDYLVHDGVRLCVWRSQNAKDHFFRNDDGKGLKKAAKLDAIRAKCRELKAQSEALYEAIDTTDLTEEEIAEAYAQVQDPYAEKLQALSSLPCFSTIDAPYEATLRELTEAYETIS